jgi:hypothetical protein
MTCSKTLGNLLSENSWHVHKSVIFKIPQKILLVIERMKVVNSGLLKLMSFMPSLPHCSCAYDQFAFKRELLNFKSQNTMKVTYWQAKHKCVVKRFEPVAIVLRV